MRYTANYNLKKPEGTDIVNIDDLNENADIIDQKLKELEDGVYNAPPNSVNDAAIGSRTPDQSQAPASPGTGTLTQLISWLANRIKAITGKTNWWDAPPTTLQAAKNHIDAVAPHSGHETPAGSQAKANTAEANAKAYTDAHEQKAAPHSGHETPAGAQAKANTAEANAKNYAGNLVGSLSSLATTAKDNIVAAINEVYNWLNSTASTLTNHISTNASTSQRGHVQLSTSIDNTSTTLAATASAVNEVREMIPSKDDILSFEPGDLVIIESTPNASTTSTSFVNLKGIRVLTGGTVRARCTVSAGSAAGYFQFYRNSTPIGTETRVGVSTQSSITADISVSPNDVIYVCGRTTNSSYSVSARNFSIRVSRFFGVSIVLE